MMLPPDPAAFNALVWLIVRQIPAGQVSTYGQIASMIPAPAGADETDYQRLGAVWVGKAMNAVSARDDGDVPWQRVINSQGGISLPEGSRAAVQQRQRLEQEGVTFDSRQRVDLKRWGWDGPLEDWLRQHRLYRPVSLRAVTDDKPQQMSLF
jgi:methylated-DNA-protein-cysteine methyltransferase related protein